MNQVMATSSLDLSAQIASIFVKDFTSGTSNAIKVDLSLTLAQFKEKMAENGAFQIDAHTKVLYNGRALLEDCFQLKDMGLKTGSTLHLCSPQLNGGTDRDSQSFIL